MCCPNMKKITKAEFIAAYWTLAEEGGHTVHLGDADYAYRRYINGLWPNTQTQLEELEKVVVELRK